MYCSCGRASRLIRRIIVCATTLCYPLFAFAEFLSPLNVSNYSPVVAIHGLPYTGDAEVLDRGSVNSRLMVDVSSHYALHENSEEYILLDGETTRTTFIYRQGVRHNMEVSVIIPHIRHHAGSLDSFINSWHETFGMPEGGRDQTENNQFHYTYRRQSQTLFDVQTPGSGIGDVRVQGAWQLQQSDAAAAALAMSVKLPTGDSDNLRGSGAADVAMWYKGESRQEFFAQRGGSFYSIGAMVVGKGDVLSDMVRRFVGFGGLGAGVYLSDSLVFISQLDVNTPLYSSSDLVELSSYAVQLTLGGSIILSDRGRINVGVAEDLVIDASPDVTFHADVAWRF